MQKTFSNEQGGGGSSGGVEARTPVIPQPGTKPPGPGQMPPKVKSRQYTKTPMRFYHAKGHEHNTLRDLGFSGVLNGEIVWTFGDTLMGTEEANMICATDSIAIGSMSDPMSAVDTALWPNSDAVKEWIPCNAAEEAEGGLSVFAYGGTNIVEYAPNQGLVYYLKIHRPGGVQRIIGAGVATVTMGPNRVPEARRAGDHMWGDDEPNWGDIGIAYNAQDKCVYAYGHGPNGDNELCFRGFLCRAPAAQATDISAYEYWDNVEKAWTRRRFSTRPEDRLGDGYEYTKLTNEHALFGWMEMNQSAPFWSNYFNKWMFLHSCCFPFSDVLCRTADKLEGPWTDHGSVADTKPEGHGEGMRYCVTGHPEFDPSGQTVLVTWTRNNLIWGVVIEWE